MNTHAGMSNLNIKIEEVLYMRYSTIRYHGDMSSCRNNKRSLISESTLEKRISQTMISLALATASSNALCVFLYRLLIS